MASEGRHCRCGSLSTSGRGSWHHENRALWCFRDATPATRVVSHAYSSDFSASTNLVVHPSNAQFSCSHAACDALTLNLSWREWFWLRIVTGPRTHRCSSPWLRQNCHGMHARHFDVSHSRTCIPELSVCAFLLTQPPVVASAYCQTALESTKRQSRHALHRTCRFIQV